MCNTSSIIGPQHFHLLFTFPDFFVVFVFLFSLHLLLPLSAPLSLIPVSSVLGAATAGLNKFPLLQSFTNSSKINYSKFHGSMSLSAMSKVSWSTVAAAPHQQTNKTHRRKICNRRNIM